MHPFFEDLKTFVFDTLFPVYCLVCGKEGVFLCELCGQNLERLQNQICVACHKPSLLGFTHPRCSQRSLPEITLSVLNYHDKNVAKLIIQGKYYFLPEVYKLLTQIAVNDLKQGYFSEVMKNFVIVPLPLAKKRLRWRGFNQAEIISGVLSEKLNLPIYKCLERKVNTKIQKDLNREARKQNVTGAFYLKAGESVEGKNILLVDDVLTTGFTLCEAVKVLKKNGAKKVFCITLARD